MHRRAVRLAGQEARTLPKDQDDGNSGQGVTADEVPAIPLVGYNIFVLKGAEEYLPATSEYKGLTVRGAEEARNIRGDLKQ
jgi:hypothetical protein